MFKRTKMVTAVVLALAMTFSACGSTSTGTADTSTTDASTGAVEESGTKASGISAPGELPFVKEPVTLVVATPQSGAIEDYTTNEQTLEIEKETGIKIEWMLLPNDYVEKVNLMFSSGEQMPDVFIGCSSAFNASMMATLGAQGMLEPLDSLIESEGFYTKQQFEKYPLLKELVTSSDGHIYGLPKYSRNEAGYFQQHFWINQKFLDALGMEMPQTTEEFYEYLKAVKEKDPNGNGKADEIPIAASSSGNGWMQQIDGFLMMPFVYCDTNNSTNANDKRRIYMNEDGTIAYAAVSEGWREGLRFLNRLYSEGLMSTDVFTNDGDTLRSLVENEDAAIVGSLPSGGPNAFANNQGERRKDYVALTPLEGPDGTRQAYYNPYDGIEQGRSVIPAASKNKELAFKLIDYLFSDYSFLRGRYGVEGRDWKVPEAGTKAFDGTDAKVEVIGDLVWGDIQNVYLMCNYGYCQAVPSHSMIDDGDPYNLEAVLWGAKESYEPYANSCHVPPLTLTADEAAEFNEINATLNQYVDLSFAEFVTGERDLDKDWDAYVAECENIGYKRIIEIDQTAFDRQWGDVWTW